MRSEAPGHARARSISLDCPRKPVASRRCDGCIPEALSRKSGRRSGSSLKFCYIARGDADFYPRLGPTKEWDTAAGQAILEAAGGSVTRLSGTPLTYGKADVAYLNPHIIAWARGPIAPQEAE